MVKMYLIIFIKQKELKGDKFFWEKLNLFKGEENYTSSLFVFLNGGKGEGEGKSALNKHLSFEKHF